MSETPKQTEGPKRRRGVKRKITLAFVSIVVVVVAVGLSLAQSDWGEGKLEGFLIPVVESALDADISYESFDIKTLTFYPRAVVRNVTVDWRPENAPESATAETVNIKLPRINLRNPSQVRIRAIEVDGVVFYANLVEKKLVGLPVDRGRERKQGDEKVRIDEIRVKNGVLHATVDKPDIDFTMTRIGARIVPDPDGYRVEMEAEGERFRLMGLEESVGTFASDMYINRRPFAIDVERAEAELGAGTASAEGTVGPGEGFHFDVDAQFPLEYWQKLDPQVPDFVGVAHWQGDVILREAGEYAARGTVRVPGAVVDGYPIGDVTTHLDIDPRRVEATDVLAEGLAGGTITGALTVAMNDDAMTRGRLRVRNLEFAHLLQNSNVPNSHVMATVSGDVVLEGPSKPYALDAEVQLVADRFTWRDLPWTDSRTPGIILRLPRAHIRSRVHYTKKGFKILSAEARVGQGSLARVTGSMEFQGAVDFEYEIARADLEELGPVGGLKMKGIGPARGRVHGDMPDLRIVSLAKLNGYELEGVRFGDGTATLITEGGVLSSADTVFRKGPTIYSGDWKLDFNDEDVPIAFNVTSRQGRLTDVVTIWPDSDALGEDVDGDIEWIEAHMTGPIKRLTGDFVARATHVTAWGETFRKIAVSQGRFTDGRIQIGNAVAEKKTGRIFAQGSLDTDGALKAHVRTEAFRLGEIDHLGESFFLQGGASAQLSFGGQVSAPTVRGHILLRENRLLGRRTLPPSRIDLETTNGVLEIEAQLAGGELYGEADVAMKGELPFTADFAMLQHPIAPYLAWLNPTINDGTGRASGTVKMSGDVAKIGDMQAQVTLTELFIARGARNVRTPQVARLGYDRGAWYIDSNRPLRLIGPVDPKTSLPQRYVTAPRGRMADACGRPVKLTAGQRAPDWVTDFEMAGTSRNDGGELDYGACGQVDLAFVDLLVDAFARVEGELRLAPPPPRLGVPRDRDRWHARLTGPPDDPRLDVWAQVKAGAFKSKFFPVGVSEVSGKVYLNEDEVVLGVWPRDRSEIRPVTRCQPGHAIEANVGGGNFTGCGSLELEGLAVEQWDVIAELKDPAMLRFPERKLTAVVSTKRYLAFQGTPGKDLALTGDLKLHSLRYTEEFDWKAKAVALRLPQLLQVVPDPQDELFDLNLTLDGSAGEIRLKNETATIEFAGDLRIAGNTAAWGILGDLRLLRGTARFMDTEFTLTSGHVEFDDPNTLDFDMRLSGESVVQDYNVSVEVSGRYTEFPPRFQFESQPHLDPDQLNILLLLGVPPGELTGREVSALGALFGSVAGEGILRQRGELFENITEGLPLDSVEVVPSYSETGDIGLRLVGRKFTGKKKNTEWSGSLDTEGDVAWQVEHKATRRLRLVVGCDHGERQGPDSGTGEIPDALGQFQAVVGDCSADARFRFEWK